MIREQQICNMYLNFCDRKQYISSVIGMLNWALTDLSNLTQNHNQRHDYNFLITPRVVTLHMVIRVKFSKTCEM